MGLAASQARLLSITSRLSDNELRTQLINNSKMRLATESSRVSEDYINALNSATMMMTNYDVNGNETTQALTFNALTAYSPSNNQYGLVDTNGRIFVSGKEANLFEQANGDLDSYLESHGLKYTTSYFNNSTFGDWYNAETGKVDLKMENEEGNMEPYASYTAKELEAMYLGGTHKEFDVNGNVIDSTTYPSYEASQMSSEYFNYLEKYQAYDTAVADYVNDYWTTLNNYVTDTLSAMETVTDSADDRYTGILEIQGKNYETELGSVYWMSDLPSFNGAEKLDNYQTKIIELAGEITTGNVLANELDTVLANYGYSKSGDGQHLLQQVDAPAQPYVTYKNIGGIYYVDDIRFGLTNVNHDGLTQETNADGTKTTVDKSADNNNTAGGSALDNCNGYFSTNIKNHELEGSNWHTSYNIVVTDTALTSTVVRFNFLDQNVTAFGGRDLVADGSTVTNGITGGRLFETSKTSGVVKGVGLDAAGDNKAINVVSITNGIARVQFGYVDADNEFQATATRVDNGKEVYDLYVRLDTETDSETGDVYHTIKNNATFFTDPECKYDYKVGAKVWDDDTFDDNAESYSLDAWRYLTDFYYVTDDGEMYNVQLTGENGGDFDPYATGVPGGCFHGESGTTYSTLYGEQKVYKYATGDEIVTMAKKMKEHLLLHLDDDQQLFNIQEATRIMGNCGSSKMNDAYYAALKETVFQYLDSVFVTKDADGNVLTGRDADGNFVGEGYEDLYNALWQDADKIGDIKWILANYGANPAFQEILESNDTFNSIKKQGILEQLFEIFGEPKMGWVDTADNNADGTKKAEWYTNLFNKMKDGYKVLEQGLTGSKDWIQYALESGLATVVQVDKARNWTGAGYKNIKEITEVVDEKAVAVAEAQYNKAMNDIENKDKRFDMELKNIDTEHNALQQEYETIKSVISKNVERTFKYYS